MSVPLSLSTVPAQTPYVQYVATSGQTVFPYPFEITQDSDLVALVNAVPLGTDVGYTLTGQGNSTGGNLVFTLGQTAGAIVTLYRSITIARVTQLAQNGTFFSSNFNNEFNNLYLITQQLEASIAQCLQIPNTNNPAPTTVLAKSSYAGMYLSFDANGNPVPAALTSSGSITGAIIAGLLNLVTTTAPTADKVRSPTEISLGITPVNYAYGPGHAWRYGADPSGAINSTAALYNMYMVCIGDGISTGCAGYIPVGTYKVTTGVLIFDNGFVDKAWPNIYTGGYQQTVYAVDAATATNAPVLQWKNGTASSTSGNFWRGGSHGGITISDQTGASAPNRHGMSWTGMWSIDFGYVRGLNLRGDVINIPTNLYTGTDPDPYGVNLLRIEGIEAFNGAGWAINNLNYVGFNGCTITDLFCAGGIGGWFGVGAQNTVVSLSAENVAGYVVDDGTFVDHTGGSSAKFTIMNAEIDNCQYAFRFNAIQTANVWNCRIIHRFQTAPNVAANYWPQTAVQFAAGASGNSQQINMQLWHRLEVGGAHGDIGVWTDFANAGGNIIGVNVDHVLDNQTAITVVDSDYYANLNANSQVLVTYNGRPIADRRAKPAALYYGDGTTAITNSGYGTAAAKILFPVKQYDAYNAVTTSVWTAPYAGQAEFLARFRMTMASANSMRIGMLQTGSVAGLAADSTFYQVNVGTQTYELKGTIQVALGDTLSVVANQSTATGSIACDAGSSQQASNIFQIKML